MKLTGYIIAIILGGYCGGAFVSMSFNPNKWNIETRAVAVIVTCVILSFVVITLETYS